MTKEDILLIKELIKESVRTVIKEELANVNKKDLKEVKLLLAKIIKEGVAYNGSEKVVMQEHKGTTDPEFKRRLREAVGGDFDRVIQADSRSIRSVMPPISAEQAANISVNGTLPDIDAPIPFIDKNSATWKALQEKIG